MSQTSQETIEVDPGVNTEPAIDPQRRNTIGGKHNVGPTKDKRRAYALRYGPGVSGRLAHVGILQGIVTRLIKAKDVEPQEVSSLVRAWDVLEERRRVLKGQGTPKPVDASNASQQPTKDKRDVLGESVIQVMPDAKLA